MTSLENTEDMHDGNVDTKRKEESGPSFLETALPIPDFFYDVRATLPLIGSSPGKVRAFTNVIYLVTIGVFIATFAYYSLPAQLLSEETVVSSEWQKSGYVCKPLQNAMIHGFNTDWSYDECVARVTMPVEETVVSIEKGDGSTHFDYQFVTDSLDARVSFYDDRIASSVLQRTSDGWSRNGYSCHPEPPYDNYFNIDMNYSECTHLISPPSAQTVTIAQGQ